MATSYELSIDVQIRDRSGQFGGLRVSESVVLNVTSFLELALVLGKFHELAEELAQVGPAGD